MSFDRICYDVSRRDSRNEMHYSLEEAGREIGRIICKRGSQGSTSEFLFEAEGYPDLRWTCDSVEHSKEGVSCRIVCPDFDWDFPLRFPRTEAATVALFEEGWSLTKKQTLVVWGPGSFYLIAPDGNEHSWEICFDTGCFTALSLILKLATLGFFPRYSNENWIAGCEAAGNLTLRDQQKLAILNATFRMELLPNDFSSGG